MAAIRVKDDRHETRLKPSRNHGRENLKRQTTSLAREESQKRMPLLLRGPLIDERKRRAVPEVHGLREAASKGSSQAVQAQVAVVSLADVPGSNVGAVAFRRWGLKVARTSEVAAARLQKVSFQVPFHHRRHLFSLLYRLA